ncbi:MAG: ABC transporter ATP-binding protein [Chthoniobacteraceae bacterium]|jgi:ATP-binding cassette subfamily B protein
MAQTVHTLTHVTRDEERDVELRPMQFLRIMRRIFSYAMPHRRIIILLGFLTTIRSIQLPLVAHLLSAVINGPIAHKDFHGIIVGAGAFGALAIFTQVTLGFRVLYALEIGELVVRDMRNAIFEHLQGLTASFFGKMKVGRIISRMSSDLEAIRLGVQDIVFMSIVGFGQALFAAILMFRTDKVLFCLILVMGPIIWAFNRHFSRHLIHAQREAQESFSRVTATLAESVTGIRVTQGFVREETNSLLFRDLLQDHSRYSLNAARTGAMFLPILELNSQVFIGLLLLLGGWRVLHHQTSLGAIVEFFFQSNMFFDPIRNLSTQYTQAFTALVGAERVFRLLDTPPDWTDPPSAKPIRDVRGHVEFRDVNFGYDPNRLILHDVSFEALPGQTIALVGHTGSGKTSVTNLITKAWLPTSGALLIDGRDILQITTPSLRKHLGVVQQSNFLFEGTILDNIRFSRPEATLAEVMDTARKLDCLDLFETLPDGWNTQVGEAGNALSLGQRQLVCFARALLADPRVFILDEATSSIDAITESRLQKSLALLLRGRTSFVIAHRLSTIRQADLILVMANGRIIERGTHAELLAMNGAYHDLYTQFVRVD